MTNQLATTTAASDIRGFDIRVLFDDGKILAASDPLKGGALIAEATGMAEKLGLSECEFGEHVPETFEDEPVLGDAWRRGFWPDYQ